MRWRIETSFKDSKQNSALNREFPQALAALDIESIVQNVVCTGELQQEINLNALSIGLGLESVEYDPE